MYSIRWANGGHTIAEWEERGYSLAYLVWLAKRYTKTAQEWYGDVVTDAFIWRDDTVPDILAGSTGVLGKCFRVRDGHVSGYQCVRAEYIGREVRRGE